MQLFRKTLLVLGVAVAVAGAQVTQGRLTSNRPHVAQSQLPAQAVQSEDGIRLLESTRHGALLAAMAADLAEEHAEASESHDDGGRSLGSAAKKAKKAAKKAQKAYAKLVKSLKKSHGKNSVCLEVAEKVSSREESSFSSCLNDPFTTSMINQLGEACDSHDRTACTTTQGCLWVGSLWASNQEGSKIADETHKCVPDPCYRINNGRCTLQATGGRCVWYTKSAYKALTGGESTHAACRQSPCNNPTDNTAKGCKASSNDFYQCQWCGKTLGCHNAKLTSKAQCWNLGQSAKCSSCQNNNLSFEPNCKTSKCDEHCCDSPYCTCLRDDFRVQDEVPAALDISGRRR